MEKEKPIKYRTFKIPKRRGGFRKIEQPLGDGLEILQKKLAEMEKIPELKPSYFCHSFMRGRNIVTCADQHWERDKKTLKRIKPNKVLVRLDIKEFFPSVTWENFYEVVLKPRDYNAKQKEIDKAKKIHESIKICFRLDKKKKVHYLPQGAPTSPFLSNAYLRRFDWENAWFCYRNGVVYNRYADDLFLSYDKNDKVLWSCIYCIHNKLKQIHLEENKPKRKVMYPGKRMNIVGVVINEKFQIPKKTRRVIRAILHNSEKKKKPLNAEQKGLLNFKQMVDKYPKHVKNNLMICQEYEILDKI